MNTKAALKELLNPGNLHDRKRAELFLIVEWLCPQKENLALAIRSAIIPTYSKQIFLATLLQ